MSKYLVENISYSSDSCKLFTLVCRQEKLSSCISFLQNHSIPVVNIGKEIAKFIQMFGDHEYLDIEVSDKLRYILDSCKKKILLDGNDTVAIYNLGILFEPSLKLNVAKLFRDYAKTVALVIVWESQFESPSRLKWVTQRSSMLLDFTETPLKEIVYEI